MNPYVILLCICAFREYRLRDVPTFVVTVGEVSLGARHETSLQSGGEDSLDKACSSSLSVSALFVFPFKESYVTRTLLQLVSKSNLLFLLMKISAIFVYEV
jgi:hypothetical protein